MGAGQHLLQQDIAFAQPLEQGDRVGTQNLAGLLHLGHGRDRHLARLLDRRARSLLQLAQRLADGAGGKFAGGRNRPRDFGAVAQYRLRERLAAGFDRFQRFRGDAVDIECELVRLAGDSLDQGPALAVDHLCQPIGLLLHLAHDLVGLAGHRRAEGAAGGKHRAFDFRRRRFDLGADLVRCGHQRVLRALRAGLDIVGGFGGDRRERAFDVGPDGGEGAFHVRSQRLDVIGGIGGRGHQRGLRLARAVEDGGGCGRAGGRQRSLDVGGQRLDLARGVAGGGHQAQLGVAGAGQDRARGRGADRGEGAFDLARGQLQLRADVRGDGKQRLLGGARAGLNGLAGIDHEVGERALRILDMGADAGGKHFRPCHQIVAGLTS